MKSHPRGWEESGFSAFAAKGRRNEKMRRFKSRRRSRWPAGPGPLFSF